MAKRTDNSVKTEALAALEPTRKEVLLRAAYDLLKKASESHFVEQATAIVVRYDDADCDGHCLMEDIACELGIKDEFDHEFEEEEEEEEGA